jgi:hypothetical protein
MVGSGAVSLVAYWHLWLPARRLLRPVPVGVSRQGTGSDGATGTRSWVAVGVWHQVPSRWDQSVKVHLVVPDEDNLVGQDVDLQSAVDCCGEHDADIVLPGHDRHVHRVGDHEVVVHDCGFGFVT